ncbi:MAG: HU family DNA-binding protein [Clostridia bacterium]|nr:HU family DNA-binding protein [Clostridia bacterium]
MNKTELIAALANKTGASRKDSELFMNAFVELVKDTLCSGEKVQLVGLGTFERKDRAARVARNPQTGEQVDIAESKAVVFKAGKALKDAVNE